MKRIGKVFLGVLFVILLFAFSHASAGNICASNIKLEAVRTKEKVTFAWNPVKKYNNIRDIDEKDSKIMYEVYSYQLNGSGDSPKTGVKNFKYEGETDKTYFEIKFQQTGEYVLGVRALLYKSKDGKPIGEPINKSTISWSCNKNCTNNNPQYVEVSNQN